MTIQVNFTKATVEVIDESNVLIIEQPTTEVVEVARTGPQGPESQVPGPPGEAYVREALTGVQNSVNTVFTTSQAFIEGSTLLYLNGLVQSTPGDYSETGATEITMVEAPDSVDKLLIVYSIVP